MKYDFLFHHLPITSGPVIWYHWEEASSLFISAIQVFRHMDNVLPENFSCPGWTILALSAFPCMKNAL